MKLGSSASEEEEEEEEEMGPGEPVVSCTHSVTASPSSDYIVGLNTSSLKLPL